MRRKYKVTYRKLYKRYKKYTLDSNRTDFEEFMGGYFRAIFGVKDKRRVEVPEDEKFDDKYYWDSFYEDQYKGFNAQIETIYATSRKEAFEIFTTKYSKHHMTNTHLFSNDLEARYGSYFHESDGFYMNFEDYNVLILPQVMIEELEEVD